MLLVVSLGLVVGTAGVGVLGGAALVLPAAAATAVRVENLAVPGTREAGGRPVSLDTSLYLPATATASSPAPAIMLAHGFGGTKADVADEARRLAGDDGYVVLAWTARGFGRSGGLIHIDHPGYEVADARRLVALLARRPEVLRDAPGDPRVGVAGGSYGGALALMLAGTDKRIDAIAPSITWNDLRQGLVPQHAVVPGLQASPAALPAIATPGVFKRLWAGVFFGSAGGGTGTCGRFAPDLCAAYAQVARTGQASPALLDRLAQSSPMTVLAGIHAPTLLLQGEQDSLFPLSQADANAAGIAKNGTPVSVVWFNGGHDAGGAGLAGSSAGGAGGRAAQANQDAEAKRIENLTVAWFDRYLRGDRAAAVPAGFEVTVPDAAVSSTDSEPAPLVRKWSGEPGITGPPPAEPLRLALSGPVQRIVSPPGGTPAAISSLPGLGALLGLLSGAAGAAPAGQAAVFSTAPMKHEVRLVGSPRVRLHVTSSAGDATLFAAVHVVSSDGRGKLPEQLVSPVHLVGLPAGGADVSVALPAVVVDVPAGATLRVVVTSTDQAYALPADGRTYTVALAGSGSGSGLQVPQFATAAEPGDSAVSLLAVLGVVVGLALLAALVLALLGRRRRIRSAAALPERPDLAGVPLAVESLGKEYGDGFRAVSDLTFRVAPGQVLGLLGPNGAGKTTTLRMALGLIRPTEGTVFVFGHEVRAGSPVLARVGSFVEGPGLLPHLSGLANLKLYWLATGRPEADAHLDAALEVAGLGSPQDKEGDLNRKVKKYSQGMRQRLAIAQSMLGLPDLLVLDEPTNGLDPPQIREMRDVLRRYAASGRTVVVSSHQLAEVEQTCTHVVVMRKGRLAALGLVADLVGEATSMVVDVDEPARAAQVAQGVPGAREVRTTPSGLVLRLDPEHRPDLVRALVGAGLAVDRMAPQRGLEEAFLALVEAEDEDAQDDGAQDDGAQDDVAERGAEPGEGSS